MIQLSQETEALAQRLAAAQQLSVDDAIRQALEARARGAGLTAVPAPGKKPRDNSPEAIGARRSGLSASPPRSPNCRCSIRAPSKRS